MFNVFPCVIQVDESSRQREEINGLLSQVCDLQKRVQKYSHENDDLKANLRVYQVRIRSHSIIIHPNVKIKLIGVYNNASARNCQAKV